MMKMSAELLQQLKALLEEHGTATFEKEEFLPDNTAATEQAVVDFINGLLQRQADEIQRLQNEIDESRVSDLNQIVNLQGQETDALKARLEEIRQFASCPPSQQRSKNL